MCDLVVDLGLTGQIGFRDTRRVNEVEHSRLIARQTHCQQPGQLPGVVANGIDRSGSRRLFWSSWHHAGFAVFRLLQLDSQLILHVAAGSEMLVELNLLALAESRHWCLTLIRNC